MSVHPPARPRLEIKTEALSHYKANYRRYVKYGVIFTLILPIVLFLTPFEAVGGNNLQVVFDEDYFTLQTTSGEFSGNVGKWDWRFPRSWISYPTYDLYLKYYLDGDLIAKSTMIFKREKDVATYTLPITPSITVSGEFVTLTLTWSNYYLLGNILTAGKKTNFEFRIISTTGSINSEKYYTIRMGMTPNYAIDELTYLVGDPFPGKGFFNDKYNALTGTFWDLLKWWRGNDLLSENSLFGVNFPANILAFPTEIIFDITCILPAFTDLGWLASHLLSILPLTLKIVLDGFLFVLFLSLLPLGLFLIVSVLPVLQILSYLLRMAFFPFVVTFLLIGRATQNNRPLAYALLAMIGALVGLMIFKRL